MKPDEQRYWIPQNGQFLWVTGQHRRDHVAGMNYSMPGRPTGMRVVQSITGSWWVLYDRIEEQGGEHPDAGPFPTVDDAKAYAEATYILERGL